MLSHILIARSSRRSFVRRSIVVGASLAGGVALLSASGAAAAARQAGQNPFAIADGPLNLRDPYGLDAPVIGTYPTGATGLELSTGRTVEADGYNWVSVRMDADGAEGYMAVEFLDLGAIPTGFTVVDGPLNVRSEPGLAGGIIATVSTGATGSGSTNTIVRADGYSWLFADILADDGSIVSGYVAIDFLAFD